MIELYLNYDVVTLKTEICKPSYVKLENALICSSGIHVKSGTLRWSFTTGQHFSQTYTYHFPSENRTGNQRNLGPPFHRMTGAERSFVTVGRSFTVAKGFSLLGRRGEKKIVGRNTSRPGIWFGKRANNSCSCSVKLYSLYNSQTFSEHESFVLWQFSPCAHYKLIVSFWLQWERPQAWGSSGSGAWRACPASALIQKGVPLASCCVWHLIISCCPRRLSPYHHLPAPHRTAESTLPSVWNV